MQRRACLRGATVEVILVEDGAVLTPHRRDPESLHAWVISGSVVAVLVALSINPRFRRHVIAPTTKTPGTRFLVPTHQLLLCGIRVVGYAVFVEVTRY